MRLATLDAWGPSKPRLAFQKQESPYLVGTLTNQCPDLLRFGSRKYL